jgi:hypothetical protein
MLLVPRHTLLTDKKQRLVEQLLYKAKQVEVLIRLLPSSSKAEPTTVEDRQNQQMPKDDVEQYAEDNDKELQELEKEMQAVNGEYLEVLETAGKLCRVI